MKAYVASDIRDMNRRTIFELARQMGDLSRVDISRITGISPPTVMKVTNFFIDSGILIVSGEVDTAVGRKPQLLSFNPNAAFSIGVEFEGEYLRAGLVNLEGDILVQVRRRISHQFGPAIVEEIVTCVDKLLADHRVKGTSIMGIGMGIPGVVDIENYIIEFAPLVGILHPYDASDICEEIYQETGLPILIENDVNAATIGEFVVRSMDKKDDLLFISMGTGLGSGIILNGELRRGSNNLAGEIGYYVIDNHYQTDHSRPGWLESQVNLEALMKRFNFELDAGMEGKDLPHGMTSYIVHRLAPCIANMATQLDISLVVMGGVIAELMGDNLIKSLGEAVNRLSLSRVNVELQKSSEPGVTGLADLASGVMLDEFLGGNIETI